MYESHFGLSASPFQLNPDPTFYFDSKGHSKALAYLRYGAYQGEGFIVVTGEIGAGKTTLVRTLMSELESGQSVVAQIVSTQLEAGELVRAILAAFGVACASDSKATLIASLEAFLTALATKGQRALLIVDEAQNLNQEAVEELRMLSNFQIDRHALLQSFLVGQPDLRKLLQSPSMEQLRQRVIASCHLGPLDAGETAAYVKHRLGHVGWQGRPGFRAEAFDAIHRFSGGIPRRINLLCNRLLLGAYLDGIDDITLPCVEQVTSELHVETGISSLSGSAASAASGRPVSPTLPPPVQPHVRQLASSSQTVHEPLLFFAETAMEVLKARALAACLRDGEAAQDVVCVTPRHCARIDSAQRTPCAFVPAALEICLGVQEREGPAFIAAVLHGIDAVIDDLRPRAVIVIGDGDAALACSLAAHKKNVRLLHLEGGRRSPGLQSAAAVNAALIDRLASLVVTDRVSAHSVLSSEGIAPERVIRLGSLMTDVLQALADGAPDAGDVVKQYGGDGDALEDERGFGLLTLRIQGAGVDEEMVEFLGEIGSLPPMVWLVDAATEGALRAAGLTATLDAARVMLLPCLPLPQAVALLRHASCLVPGTGCELTEAAEALGVPWVQFSSAATALRSLRAGRAARPPSRASGTDCRDTPGQRIAQHLRPWLAS